MRSRSRAAALVGRADCRVRAQDRPADAGDRLFVGVLAAHRRAADGCCRHRTEIRSLPEGPGRNERQRWTDDSTHAGAGPGEPVQLLSLRIPSPSPAQIATWSCATRSSALRWNGRATGDRASRRNCVATDGRSQADAGKQPVVRAAAQVSGHH
jgi:hypothetical protein